MGTLLHMDTADMDIATLFHTHFMEHSGLFEDNIFDFSPFGIDCGTHDMSFIIFNYYFGIDVTNTYLIDKQDKVNTLYSIYKDLIHHRCISIDLLYKCYKFNRLDDLILKKYRFNQIGYYENYIKNKYFIGKTCKNSKFDKKGNLINENKEIIIKNFEILDDDYCPNCKTKGYLTCKYGELDTETTCKKCWVTICKFCSKIDRKEPWSRWCVSCCEGKVKTKYNNSNLITNIKRKIYNHKIFDNIRFKKDGDIDHKYIEELIKKQNNKCSICKEEVLLKNWKPYCCYQFSIDRIDNNKPHNKDNVRITCYYCNCRHFPKFDQHFKICNEKCHTIKKTF